MIYSIYIYTYNILCFQTYPFCRTKRGRRAGMNVSQPKRSLQQLFGSLYRPWLAGKTSNPSVQCHWCKKTIWMLNAGDGGFFLATDVNSTISILRFVEQHGRFHGHVDANSHFPGLCFVPQQRTQMGPACRREIFEMQILHQGCELFSASPIDYPGLSSFQKISGWCVPSIISQNFNVSVLVGLNGPPSTTSMIGCLEEQLSRGSSLVLGLSPACTLIHSSSSGGVSGNGTRPKSPKIITTNLFGIMITYSRETFHVSYHSSLRLLSAELVMVDSWSLSILNPNRSSLGFEPPSKTHYYWLLFLLYITLLLLLLLVVVAVLIGPSILRNEQKCIRYLL